MTKKTFKALSALLLSAIILAACGDTDTPSVSASTVVSVEKTETASVSASVEITTEDTKNEKNEEALFALEDGVYSVAFDTDSSMFHVNESCEGRAKLTVENGEAMLHLVMPSKNVLNLFLGPADDAKKDGALILEPSLEMVTYADGFEEEVFAFDVPVTVWEEEFDLALIGKKEVWYDHKVKIFDAKPWSDTAGDTESKETSEATTLEEGTYQVRVSFEGGTGKVKLESPTKLEKTDDGYIVTLIWSSKHYDYMLVDEVKYLPIDNDEHSLFEIPVKDISVPLCVIADTVAMSTPHEIEYVITFDCDSIE